MSTKPFRCQNCVMLSTRPRIEFDERGWCNACVWAEEKRTGVDWAARRKKLEQVCDKHRSKDGRPDVIVGVSGGKDSSYVSHVFKHKLRMHPLTVTVAIPLPFDLGNQNLENFIAIGFDHLRITPNPVIMRKVNTIGLLEQGRPLYGWQIGIQVAMLRTALAFRIPFLMYGEDGEIEYGGTTETKDRYSYSVNYGIRVYLSGYDPRELVHKLAGEYTEKELYWFLCPSEQELAQLEVEASHWSYFENWDPYAHYVYAKTYCGLQERRRASVGTYTNFAQTDTPLFDLHMYLMFLKFGFGRCSQDAGIDIRRGAMTRKQALELVRIYDSQFPEDYLPLYLDYYRMTREEFEAVLDHWANKELLRKEGGRWVQDFPFE